MNKIQKTLIVSRGEIAVRIIKCLREMGIKTIAAYSTADSGALFTRLADESICIGSNSVITSYLNTYDVLSAATIKRVDSIHPGIGFLAENWAFSGMCRECGIQFVGPDEKILAMMGDKNEAKKVAKNCGLPVIPGSTEIIESIEECYRIANEIGYPIILKVVGGGGGKGIRRVDNANVLEYNYNVCKKEVESAFQNERLIIEKLL